MMLHFLLVGLGGALGAMLRHGTNLLALRWLGPDFPYGTMAINITGSILIGIVAGLLAHVTQWTQELRLFAVVGILGGYTTFRLIPLTRSCFLNVGIICRPQSIWAGQLFYRWWRSLSVWL